MMKEYRSLSIKNVDDFLFGVSLNPITLKN